MLTGVAQTMLLHLEKVLITSVVVSTCVLIGQIASIVQSRDVTFDSEQEPSELAA